MTPQEIKAKVRKLLALAANNPSEHEARAAAAAATRLVEEYRLSMSEIEADTGSAEKPVVDEDPLIAGGKVATWQKRLVVYLCDAHGCVAWSYRRIMQDNTVERCVGVVGRPCDVAVVRELYAYLSLELTRIAGKRKLSRDERNSWYLGAVHGILNSLEAARKDARKGATSTAIVLVDTRQKEAEQVMQAKVPDIKNEKARKVRADYSAYVRGMQDGRGLSLSRSTQLEPTHHPERGEQMHLGFAHGSQYDSRRRSS